MTKPFLASAFVLALALPAAAAASGLVVQPAELHLSATKNKSGEITVRYAKHAGEIGIERGSNCWTNNIASTFMPSNTSRAPHQPLTIRVEARGKTGSCVLDIFASTDPRPPRMVDRFPVRVTVAP